MAISSRRLEMAPHSAQRVTPVRPRPRSGASEAYVQILQDVEEENESEQEVEEGEQEQDEEVFGPISNIAYGRPAAEQFKQFPYLVESQVVVQRTSVRTVRRSLTGVLSHFFFALPPRRGYLFGLLPMPKVFFLDKCQLKVIHYNFDLLPVVIKLLYYRYIPV